MKTWLSIEGDSTPFSEHVKKIDYQYDRLEKDDKVEISIPCTGRRGCKECDMGRLKKGEKGWCIFTFTVIQVIHCFYEDQECLQHVFLEED